MSKFKIILKSRWRQLRTKVAALPSEDFGRDFAVRALIIAGLIMVVVIWIFAMLSFPPSDYLVPLRYNSFLGVTALGSWYQLYAVPLILVLIYITNTFLAHAAYQKDKMVSYVLLGSSLFAMVCGAAVVFNLWRVISL